MIKQQIEKNADKIWKFLDESQVSSVFEIMKALSIEKQDVLMALGWLAPAKTKSISMVNRKAVK